MVKAMPRLDVTTTRCEALFVSDLQHSQRPSAEQVRAAVVRTVRAHGAKHCAAVVAQEFGDHPDNAVARMRWARAAVAAAYRVRTTGRSSRTTICHWAAPALPPAKAA
jgi:hypothetical protein